MLCHCQPFKVTSSWLLTPTRSLGDIQSQTALNMEPAQMVTAQRGSAACEAPRLPPLTTCLCTLQRHRHTCLYVCSHSHHLDRLMQAGYTQAYISDLIGKICFSYPGTSQESHWHIRVYRIPTGDLPRQAFCRTEK